jgi:hypothetical protein
MEAGQTSFAQCSRPGEEVSASTDIQFLTISYPQQIQDAGFRQTVRLNAMRSYKKDRKQKHVKKIADEKDSKEFGPKKMNRRLRGENERSAENSESEIERAEGCGASQSLVKLATSSSGDRNKGMGKFRLAKPDVRNSRLVVRPFGSERENCMIHHCEQFLCFFSILVFHKQYKELRF